MLKNSNGVTIASWTDSEEAPFTLWSEENGELTKLDFGGIVPSKPQAEKESSKPETSEVESTAGASANSAIPIYVPGEINPETWFRQITVGMPFGQNTLLSLEPVLNANGWTLIEANETGERVKVKPPDYQNYYRVGFGEGHWVWVKQPL